MEEQKIGPVTAPLFELKEVTFLSVFSATARVRAERITLVRGRSGSGKSTLLRMLNRMTIPSRGSVSYKGRSLSEVNPVSLRREVVMLPQQPVLFGGSVRDEAITGRQYALMPEVNDDQIRNILEAVQLDAELDSSPESFSGGEKQRLCLARVLLMEPQVLLLDEPTVGLDRETEEAVFSCIRDQPAEGRSVVAATHSPFISMLGEIDHLEFVNGELKGDANE